VIALLVDIISVLFVVRGFKLVFRSYLVLVLIFGKEKLNIEIAFDLVGFEIPVFIDIVCVVIIVQDVKLDFRPSLALLA
jgi:hypothetical protein